MLALRIVVFTAGVALTGWTLMSAIKTVILPRSVQSHLNRIVMRPLGRVMRTVARMRPSFAWRDRVMALYGPFAMLLLVFTWLVLVTIGFMGLFWSIEQLGWADAFHKSGSSLLTLGFAPIEGTFLRAMSFVEATLGLGLLALLITYLPTLYASFQRRERQVALLEVRAGTPASALVMLIRTHRIGWLDRLGDLFVDWEGWFADVEESHTTFPILSFLRSPQADRHWVVAAGTVLDAAALTRRRTVTGWWRPGRFSMRPLSPPRPWISPLSRRLNSQFGPGSWRSGVSPTSSGSHTTPIPGRAIRSASPDPNSTRRVTSWHQPGYR